MKKEILVAGVSLLLLLGCGSKVDGKYTLDISATKQSPEFREKNKQTNGGASMGLHVLGQIAENLIITDSKFRLVTFDCKLNSDLTKAECSDQNDPSAPKKVFVFSSSGDVIKIDAGDGYPVIYKKQSVK